MASLEAESALGKELQNVVQNKLMELGWNSGGLDDSALAEYIVLMVAGGKTAGEVAQELATDFISDSTGTPEFAQWLFQQLDVLTNAASNSADQAMSTSAQLEATTEMQAPNGDADMDVDTTESTQADGTIPTGPKSMRNARDKRFLGQMNKALDRSGDNKVLHRIKGAAGGAGRINAHGAPPKGPAAMKTATPKGPRATLNRLANAPAPHNLNSMHRLAPNSSNNPFPNMTPQQQMQLMAMYEQQAKMMAQIFNPQLQQGGSQGQNGNALQSSKSLFDRVNKGPPRTHYNKASAGQADGSGSGMDVDMTSQSGGAHPDHSVTMCKFNLACKNPECYFVHQSPVAPAGIAVDMTDTCSFGASCKNRKCTGKHPSPAKSGTFGGEQCKFFPNCTNPNCTFYHPTLPPCRNGADCTVANCKFFHAKVECRFDPCLNPACLYKHRDGQKRGAFNDKVWVAGEDKEHVSDRKFVDENAGEEELVVPAAAAEEAQADGIVT